MEGLPGLRGGGILRRTQALSGFTFAEELLFGELAVQVLVPHTQIHVLSTSCGDVADKLRVILMSIGARLNQTKLQASQTRAS